MIGYERVSTARQGASGLGIEAQRQAIDGFVAQRGGTLLARFTEVESGRNPDRPELKQALHLAKVTGTRLVIAKLDRLSRNAAFLLTLRDARVKFAAVDLPEANDLTVGIMVLVAQQEREAISKRTKEALAVAKARGVRLGNPDGIEAIRRAGKGWGTAPGGDRAQRRSACARLGDGGRGHPRERRCEPPGNCGGAQRARHAHPSRRPVACLDGDQPARSARVQGGSMRQPRLMSYVEAGANVVMGYGVAVTTQGPVFPLFALKTSLGENPAIGAIFTVVSLARSYVLFRACEALRR